MLNEAVQERSPMLDEAIQDEAARPPMLDEAIQDEATRPPMLVEAVQDEAARSPMLDEAELQWYQTMIPNFLRFQSSVRLIQVS